MRKVAIEKQSFVERGRWSFAVTRPGGLLIWKINQPHMPSGANEVPGRDGLADQYVASGESINP